MSLPPTPDPPIRRVVVVHAMNSSRDGHWYRALERRLAPVVDEFVLPAMPEPLAPDAEAWHAAIAEATGGTVDPETLIVAHSVANAAVLQFLSGLPGRWGLGALVNVAGFAEPQPGNDFTPQFMTGIDLDLVRNHTAARHAVISTDDPKIPRELSDRLAAALDSEVHLVSGAGHFRDLDGYAELPLVEDLALALTGGLLHGHAAG